MSEALDKNRQALKAIFGSADLVKKLTSTRIAIVTPQSELADSGFLLAEALADATARLWPNIDFSGCAAEMQLETAASAAASGGSAGDGLAIRWSPPYDCVLTISCDVDNVPAIRLGANDWHAGIGHAANCGNSKNPVGPAFAAALGAAQIFRRVFGLELADTGAAPITDGQFDVRMICSAQNLNVGTIDLGEIHVFGVGAVTHALIWLLERWPEQVSGELNLVDGDRYSGSNGQRYAFMRAADIHTPKVEAVQMRMQQAHPELKVIPHKTDVNSYCLDRGYENPFKRVVAGLDSAESRRHVALKLPEHTINMWTEGVRVGAGRYAPTQNSACLACEYLEDRSSPKDEVAQFHQQTGLQPDLIRKLLDSSRGLNEQEARAIAAQQGVQVDLLVGQPLRSILPTLCAIGKIQLPNNAEAVDVPFAFASLFSGIAGFLMLLKDISMEQEPSEGWTQHIFKSPSFHMHSKRPRREECACCAGADLRSF